MAASRLIDLVLDRIIKEKAQLGGQRLRAKSGDAFSYGLACGEFQTLERAEKIIAEVLSGDKDGKFDRD